MDNPENGSNKSKSKNSQSDFIDDQQFDEEGEMTPISIKTNKTLRKTKKGRAFIRNGFDPEADITAILNQDLSSKSKGKEITQNDHLDDNSDSNSFADNLIITNGLSEDDSNNKQKSAKLRCRKPDDVEIDNGDDSSDSSL